MVKAGVCKTLIVGSIPTVASRESIPQWPDRSAGGDRNGRFGGPWNAAGTVLHFCNLDPSRFSRTSDLADVPPDPRQHSVKIVRSTDKSDVSISEMLVQPGNRQIDAARIDLRISSLSLDKPHDNGSNGLPRRPFDAFPGDHRTIFDREELHLVRSRPVIEDDGSRTRQSSGYWIWKLAHSSQASQNPAPHVCISCKCRIEELNRRLRSPA